MTIKSLQTLFAFRLILDRIGLLAAEKQSHE
jgi:hypothetical protein